MTDFEALFDDKYKICDKVRPEYPQQFFVGVTMSKSTILNMLVLWSYVYWPAYIIGLFLIEYPLTN